MLGDASIRWGVQMDYLLIKLIWYVAGAFAFGVFAGWVSCGEPED
jgi:hypothetical protein